MYSIITKKKKTIKSLLLSRLHTFILIIFYLISTTKLKYTNNQNDLIVSHGIFR